MKSGFKSNQETLEKIFVPFMRLLLREKPPAKLFRKISTIDYSFLLIAQAVFFKLYF